MNKTDINKIYLAGKFRGFGEIMLVFIIVAIWNDGHWDTTPKWMYPVAILLGAFCIWYGTKVKVEFLDDKAQRND